MIAAWSVFSDDARKAFRSALDVDDATWARARGFALHQALLIIPYYRETNPKFAATARAYRRGGTRRLHVIGAAMQQVETHGRHPKDRAVSVAQQVVATELRRYALAIGRTIYFDCKMH